MNGASQKTARRYHHPTAAGLNTSVHRFGDGAAAIIRAIANGSEIGNRKIMVGKNWRNNPLQNLRHLVPFKRAGTQFLNTKNGREGQTYPFFHK